MAFKGFSALPGGNRLPQVSHFSDVAYQHFDLPPEQEGDEDEEPESAVLYSVDPDETPERQRLTGQSILIQTAESSHYLPWSWDKALPPEILDLETWLNHQLVSANDHDRLGAAVVWLATRLSRSLPFVLELSISELPEEEWCLTPDFALAHRKPPRRHNSWIPGKDADPFIEMYQSDLALEIPVTVQEIFQSNASRSDTSADSVHHLWYQLFEENLKSGYEPGSQLTVLRA